MIVNLSIHLNSQKGEREREKKREKEKGATALFV
jgi:hypothetical protein